MSEIKNLYHNEIAAQFGDGAAKPARVHRCRRCKEPNPDRLDMDGCRDPNCPEQGR